MQRCVGMVSIKKILVANKQLHATENIQQALQRTQHTDALHQYWSASVWASSFKAVFLPQGTDSSTIIEGKFLILSTHLTAGYQVWYPAAEALVQAGWCGWIMTLNIKANLEQNDFKQKKIRLFLSGFARRRPTEGLKETLAWKLKCARGAEV